MKGENASDHPPRYSGASRNLSIAGALTYRHPLQNDHKTPSRRLQSILLSLGGDFRHTCGGSRCGLRGIRRIDRQYSVPGCGDPEDVKNRIYGILITVKTTIEIPDELAEQTRRYAAETGLSLREVHERALRLLLAGSEFPDGRKPFRLETIVTQGQGMREGLDWDAVLELIYPPLPGGK